MISALKRIIVTASLAKSSSLTILPQCRTKHTEMHTVSHCTDANISFYGVRYATRFTI